MSQDTKFDRRSFIGSAALAIAAAELGLTNSAQSRDTKATVQSRSFGPLKQIDAGLLNVGYAESGPADGRPVILLHGWPYDIYSYVERLPEKLDARINSSAQ